MSMGAYEMGFSQPLGLLALLAVPLILYLHLFRRRFAPRRVSALFLFAADALPAAAGRTRTRLLKTVSLWSELIAALALALWLGGLHVGAAQAEAHLVLVLDDSASMQGRGPLGDTQEKARAFAQRAIRDLPASAAVTLLRTGRRPEVLAGPRARPAAALAALGTWVPRRPLHDPSRAWELGLDLAGPDGELLYLTDREDLLPPPRYRLVAFGESVDNVAILSGRRLRRGAEEPERLFVDLRAFAQEPVACTLTVEAVSSAGAAVPVLEKEVQVAPGRTLHVSLQIPRSDLPVRLRLSDDALAADNEMLLLPEPRRIVPVHVAFDEETTAALRLQRAFAALSDVLLVTRPEQARLVLAAQPGVAPPGTTELLVDAPGSERDAWIGPFLLERRHVPGGGSGPPLLAGLSLEGVVWSAGQADPPGLPLVLAGERALLSEERVRGGVRLHLNLDPRRSNLTASPDWPILLSNLLAAVRDTLPGPLHVNVRVGGEIAYRFLGAPEAVSRHVLFDPEGGGHPARGWRLLTFEAGSAGLYELKHDEVVVARFAASFVDPAESDLLPCSAADLPPSEERADVASATLGTPGGLEGRFLALLLLLALVVDWYALGRRR